MRRAIPDPRKPTRDGRLRYIPKIKRLHGMLKEADIPNGNLQAQYNPDLLPILENEHVQLLECFHQLYDTSINKPDTGEEHVYSLLSEFSLKLVEHFVHEDYQFYPYLRESMPSTAGNDDGNSIKEFHNEMMDIEHDIRALVDRYDVRQNFWEQDEKGNEKNALAKSLSLIGILLKERIVREEAYLYPLYQDKES